MWKRSLVAVMAAAAVVAMVAVVASRDAGGGTTATTRVWIREHGRLVRGVLAAVNAVPVEPRKAGASGMSGPCLRVRTAGAAMTAALPAPDARLTRAWSAVTDDITTVARFCLDASERGDLAMLDEVPNYLALTGAALGQLRVVLASFGPTLAL